MGVPPPLALESPLPIESNRDCRIEAEVSSKSAIPSVSDERRSLEGRVEAAVSLGTSAAVSELTRTTEQQTQRLTGGAASR